MKLTVGDLKDALSSIPDEEPLWITGYDDGTGAIHWGESWNFVIEGGAR